MERYILDTNLFFNMEAGVGLGKKTEDVVVNLTQAIRESKKQKQAEFFMPPRIVEEFLSFFENKEQGFIKEFFTEITAKSPHIDSLLFPASIFYRLVEDIRSRSYRGLQVGEEEIKKAGSLLLGSGNLDKKEYEVRVGPALKSFRERYRQATRFGFLDSLADLDLIMLAKEIDGFLVSSDEGVVHWGRVFGIKEMSPAIFGKKMKDLAPRHLE